MVHGPTGSCWAQTRRAPQRLVRGDELRRLVAPFQLVLDAAADEAGHVRAPGRIGGALRPACAAARSAEKRPSLRSSRTMGLPSAMYSITLFMVEMSFISLATSGFTQTSAVLSIASSGASETRPAKLTYSATPSWCASAYIASRDPKSVVE